MPLTDEQAHSLAAYARRLLEPEWSMEWPLGPINQEAVPRFVQAFARLPDKTGAWIHLRSFTPYPYPGYLGVPGPVNIETTAAVVYEQATHCSQSPNGEHVFAEVAIVDPVTGGGRGVAPHTTGACRYCRFSGEAIHAVQAWERAQQPPL